MFIRDDLETRGEVIGSNDLLIAAIALSDGLDLVTNDGEIRRVTDSQTDDSSGT